MVQAARWVLGLAFVWIGVDHFVHPGTYTKIMPAYLPAHLTLVYVSGVAEIAGGLGVLMPQTRRLAGWGLLALMVAVFPANIEDFRRHLSDGGWNTATIIRAVRLPMQLLFSAWIWWCCLARRDSGASVTHRKSGQHEISAAGGESVRAFVPLPLPPIPPLVMSDGLQELLAEALLSLGRLDGVAASLPDPLLFLYWYVRKEAVLSSQIEGTQSSLSDLMLFEIDEVPGVPVDDAAEVSNYVAALEHGLSRLRGGFPLSNRLIREIHAVLLKDTRGGEKSPGEFRRSQNWIGGTRPGNAAFVPPPPNQVMQCMSDLEQFLHATDDGIPALVRAGLAHVQFETIHPFLDGNGRVGRLLITLLLCDAGVLQEPLLYLSLYLKQQRQMYYAMLDRVRDSGDWEAWMAFFLQGVRDVATGAAATASQLDKMFQADRERIASVGRRAKSALRVHEALQARPIRSIANLQEATELTFPTAASALELLTEMTIVRELTGQKRNRLFAYHRYIEVLNEGTEL